jgi:hypothetical protein
MFLLFLGKTIIVSRLIHLELSQAKLIGQRDTFNYFIGHLKMQGLFRIRISFPTNVPPKLNPFFHNLSVFQSSMPK